MSVNRRKTRASRLLSAAMRAAGVSQAQLARELGVSQPSVWAWLHGGRPRDALCEVLRRRFDIALDAWPPIRHHAAVRRTPGKVLRRCSVCRGRATASCERCGVDLCAGCLRSAGRRVLLTLCAQCERDPVAIAEIR